jgi:hypothetical protein
MPFIDWSDSEEMVGLLIEYISDEGNESHGDRKRNRFLSNLIAEITELEERFSKQFNAEAINQLQKIYNSIDSEFKEDPVTVHIRDCIEELERLTQSSNTK